MACPQVVDGGNGLQIWRVAANIRNKQLQRANRGWFFSSKNKKIRDLYRGINEFKKGYLHRSNLVKDWNGNLLADSQTILNRWKIYCCQLLNLCRVSGVRQKEIQVRCYYLILVLLRLKLLLQT
jgi:hypothetical protein